MENSNRPEYLVGIGASAGGLQALQDFFNNMPAVDNVAFVVIQHLSPDFKSLMNQLLSNFTKMKIKIVENQMPLERDTIYLIPPKNNMIVEGGTLYLAEQERGHYLNFPINIFFNSMAKDYLNKSIAIILSGTGSDGSDGILEVSAAGGLVIAQNPETAQFDGMPRSAISTQLVNKTLDADKIPAFLSSYLQNPILPKEEAPAGDSARGDDVYGRIFKCVFKKYKVDFSDYKESTIYRRIDRRAKTLLIPSLEEYAKHLLNSDQEVDCLFNDLLIGVTSFFRDKEAFDYLEQEIIPPLFERKDDSRQLRVWVPACASGEEVFSLTMLLKEHADRLKKAYDIKVFASDLSRMNIAIGTQGSYPESALIGVSKERRERFFMKKGEKYVVIPELRNMIVFAPQNVIGDPPFTNLDLISCRNFLIYVKPEVQKNILAVFHFALNKNGILFLGPSEGIGEFSHEFSELSRTFKIYRKNYDHKVPFQVFPRKNQLAEPAAEPSPQRVLLKGAKYFKPKIYDVLLEQYLEDAIVVDCEEEILHTTGRARDFLAFQSGRMSNNVIRLIHEDLRSTITSGIHRAEVENREVIYKDVPVRSDDQDLSIDLSIRPLKSRFEGNEMLVIRFLNVRDEPPAGRQAVVREVDNRFSQLVQDLELQLQTTKENLQAALEEAETTNEELQATNEELLASNEELQSTNEELHSVNEELYTVNSEHQRKIAELETLEDDIDNLVHSSGIGTIFLDENLCIRKITPAISESYNILPHDIGRPIETFAVRFKSDDLINRIKQVQASNKAESIESRDAGGGCTLVKILPYMSQKKKPGFVITFTDVSTVKNVEAVLNMKSKELENSLRQLGDFAFHTGSELAVIFEATQRELEEHERQSRLKGIDCDSRRLGAVLANIGNLGSSLQRFYDLRQEYVRVETVSVDSLVQSICERLEKRFPGAVFEKAAKLPDVRSDGRILASVFEILMENGVKFNDSREKRVRTSCSASGDNWLFSVSDNGIGLPEEAGAQAFKMFSVLNRSASLADRGHGVGLALAKRGIELLNGRIWFTSEIGVGSIFYFSLPGAAEGG